jgi:large subunit ribosomal protein L13
MATPTIKREHHQIDAQGQAVGRVASQVAMILRGKNKPDFTPHIDNGDFVTVINAKHVKFTGKKFVQKDYKHHSMHPGGLKVVSMKRVFETDPAEVMRKAVYKMLPKNNKRDVLFKRLTVKA